MELTKVSKAVMLLCAIFFVASPFFHVANGAPIVADSITLGRWLIQVENDVLVIRDTRSAWLHGGDNRFAFYPGKGQIDAK
ncbi:hypothetical protein BV898_02573 [Hypsibius exemplaris]|uniref:Uncharacterized protein n=1 Tax=Hypsibius exemplaris TaxID=2072580 RepID=A0A1W0X855_HYPEX|nr:hypothetical protein BV898_02573 [Hypsibius exemplaris]